MFCCGFQENNTIKVKKENKYSKKKMINPKYLSPEIKDKLNRLPLELCEYRYTSKFKKDIVLKWIEIVGQKTVYIDQYLNMIDTLKDLSQYYFFLSFSDFFLSFLIGLKKRHFF